VEPRYFLRRLIAVVIDIIIFSQLTFYLIAPFADGGTYRLSGGLYQSISCEVVPLEAHWLTYFAERGVNAESGSLCSTYQNGIFAGSNLLVSSHTNENGDIAEDATTITVALGKQWQEVSPVFPVAYLQPVFMLFFFVLLTFFWHGQTIGKKSAGLRVCAMQGGQPRFMQVVRREALKFAPAIALFVIGLFFPMFSLENVVLFLKNGESIAWVFGFLGVSTFIYILWWVAPMIWWNGAMPYDRLGKTTVMRAS